ncbi:biotin--[acetyl-CoA-carboxylase] ligase [Spirochaetia bacterium]|nr:biotin--[acetyl-CoA-carboxylase] ligase [Spirochaetia bacterium]
MFYMKKIPLNNPFSAPVFHLETTGSTMLEARTLAAQGAPRGSLVMADVQEAGRGRIANRPWKAEKGMNLLFTMLLRYPGIASIPPAITLRTGLALSLAIEDFAPVLQGRIQVKWPNDVMIQLPPCNEVSREKAGAGGNAFGKTAGILTEGDGSNVYIGVGVNVGQMEFPADIRGKAASIALALGKAGGGEAPALPPDSRFRLLEAFLNRLHAELEGPSMGGEWRERLEERLYMKGRWVRFIAGAADSGRVVEGALSGIGPEGELLIQSEGGTEAFVTGELERYC